MKIRALVVEAKDAPFKLQEIELVELHQQGRFPFDRLVKFHELGQVEQALADSKSGKVIKPILRMPGRR